MVEDRGAACRERTFVLVKAKLGRLLFWLRQRLLFVLFDDLRFRSDIWFGNAAHALGCRPIAGESHMASGKAQPSCASIAPAVADFRIYNPLTYVSIALTINDILTD